MAKYDENEVIRQVINERWIGELSAYPAEMIRRLADDDQFTEVTVPTAGDRIFCPGYYDEYGEIEAVLDEDKYQVLLDDGKSVAIDREDFELAYDDRLPMWGTMWSFNDLINERWLANHPKTASECGFRIYKHDEFGYFIGIDGTDYDFYEKHWIPLYKAMGYRWHENKEYQGG